MKWYLSGPMGGIPDSNFPAFDAASQALRAQGLDIISPADLDRTNPPPAGSTWIDYLSRDIKVVAHSDGVIFLPNWYLSRGARLEAFVALLLLQKNFAQYYPDTETAHPITANFVVTMLQERMGYDAPN